MEILWSIRPSKSLTSKVATWATLYSFIVIHRHTQLLSQNGGQFPRTATSIRRISPAFMTWQNSDYLQLWGLGDNWPSISLKPWRFYRPIPLFTLSSFCPDNAKHG